MSLLRLLPEVLTARGITLDPVVQGKWQVIVVAVLHKYLVLTTVTLIQPPHPTISAFGRASTLSLGSIAFGSLIVTLLDLLKSILQAAQNNANADGHREHCLKCTTVPY